MPKPVDVLLRDAAARLRSAGIENPSGEARLLLEHASGLRREILIADSARCLDLGTSGEFDRLVEQRCRHMPFAYVVGTREFYSRDFEVGPGVLIPRPDTETLIEAALGELSLKPPGPRILDLGVGSGCILITLMLECNGSLGVGVDLQADALAYARRNARRYGLADRCLLLQGHWTDAVSGPFDLVVSNPPYVSIVEHAQLSPDVRDFEPISALVPGEDGLAAYRQLAASSSALMHADAALLVEVGAQQSTIVTKIFERHDWRLTAVCRDIAGLVRVLVLSPPAHPDR